MFVNQVDNRKEIEKCFGAFVEVIRGEKESSCLKNIPCFMNFVEEKENGKDASDLIDRYFRFDRRTLCRIQICNSIIRGNETTAAQSVILVILLENASKPQEICQICVYLSNLFLKSKGKWEFLKIQMDIMRVEGNFAKITENWRLPSCEPRWIDKSYLPQICPEIDSPWKKYPISAFQMTEEEKILEPFFCYAYGIDLLGFEHVWKALAQDAIIHMEPFGIVNKRTFIQCLKISRMMERNWVHPVQPTEIELGHNQALLRLNRLAGHGSCFPHLTAKDISYLEICGKYQIELCKEKREWKIVNMVYSYCGV